MVFIQDEERLHVHYATDTKPYSVDYKSICSSRHSEAFGERRGVLGRVSSETLLKENI